VDEPTWKVLVDTQVIVLGEEFVSGLAGLPGIVVRVGLILAILVSLGAVLVRAVRKPWMSDAGKPSGQVDQFSPDSAYR
jgi:hypothetical protein